MAPYPFNLLNLDKFNFNFNLPEGLTIHLKTLRITSTFGRLQRFGFGADIKRNSFAYVMLLPQHPRRWRSTSSQWCCQFSSPSGNEKVRVLNPHMFTGQQREKSYMCLRGFFLMFFSSVKSEARIQIYSEQPVTSL